MPSDDDLVIRPGFVIPAGELTWRYAAAGGPGGQHANTANTRVELVWDVAGTLAVGEALRDRLVAKLGPELRVVASDERSQLRNRDLAARRLADRVRAALVVPRKRVATKPTAGSRCGAATPRSPSPSGSPAAAAPTTAARTDEPGPAAVHLWARG